MKLLLALFVAVVAFGCGSGDSTVAQPGGWEKPRGSVDANNVETMPSGTVIKRDPGGDK